MTPYPSFARDLAQRYVPGVMADRARRYERDFRRRHGVTGIAQELVGNGPPRVLHGPFAGMNYPDGRLADIDAPVAKLLGSYEREIYPALMGALERGADVFIDIGCADGYYAVGVPYAHSTVTTYAFDLSASARRLCLEVARTNHVATQVRVGRRFSVAALEGIDLESALLLCDIEGAERQLFSLDLVQRLREVTVVIEVHDDGDAELSQHLRDLFASSHEVQRIDQQPREPVDGIPPAAMHEFRPQHQHWLACRPNRLADM